MSLKDDIVVGLMFGDEGKGTTVDFLASERLPASVVRFSGGAQAAHNVVMPDGTHHTFAQFGAASLRSVPTTLSRFMMVNPLSLIEEGDLIFEKCGWNPFPSLKISELCLVTTPVHIWLNRKREEARGGEAHGSCGVGVGETKYYSLVNKDEALIMKDLEYGSESEIREKLNILVSWAESEAGRPYEGVDAVPVDEIVESYLNLKADKFLNIVPDRAISHIIRKGYHIFEGSQGVLLDEWQGFHPHTTWSEITAHNAQTLLREAGKPAGRVIGVTRSYLTRHGYGPFPSEIGAEEGSALFPEEHNGFGTYQGGWRSGWFDPYLFRYAVEANGGVDVLSVTHMDRAEGGVTVVDSYGGGFPHIPSDFFGEDMDAKQVVTERLMGLVPVSTTVDSPEEFLLRVGELSGAPVWLLSYGPTFKDKVVL